MVRPSLSILEPASAIFLAALMTSDVFFSGPFPLQKIEQKDQSEVLIRCRTAQYAGLTVSHWEVLWCLELITFLSNKRNAALRFLKRCGTYTQEREYYFYRYHHLLSVVANSMRIMCTSKSMSVVICLSVPSNMRRDEYANSYRGETHMWPGLHMIWSLSDAKPHVTSPCSNSAHSNMDQLCPVLAHCVFVSHLQFFFYSMTPQGALGHSWQKTQIGFKAKLSRLKKWAIQPGTDGILCCSFFFLLLLLVCQTLSLSFCWATVKQKVAGYAWQWNFHPHVDFCREYRLGKDILLRMLLLSCWFSLAL